MKRWTRLGATAVVATVALGLGLSSATAGSPGPTPPAAPPVVTGKSPAAAQLSPLATFRPAKAETLFYPIKPCRIVDTRKAGGIMANNVARSFYVTGTAGFATQGGGGTGCGIPTAATGVATNVTATGTTADGGYLAGYPTGTTPPATNFITTHKNFALTANPTFALAAGNAKPLTVTSHVSNTNMLIDITGYYIPQIQGMVAATGKVYSGSTRILSSTRNGSGQGSFIVTVDSDVTYCTPTVIPYLGTGYYADAYAFNGNKVQVSMWSLSSTAVPVPSDAGGYFYLTVKC